MSSLTQQVGGSELIPGTDCISGWSREKSLTFILAYEPGYQTDEEGAASDNEEKRARSSR